MLAWRLYSDKSAPARVAVAGAAPNDIVVSPAARAICEKTGVLGKLIGQRWNVDEGYEALVLNPFRKIGAFLWKGFDAIVIDGVANASAFIVEMLGEFLRFFTTGNIRNYALGFSLGVLAFLVYVWVR